MSENEDFLVIFSAGNSVFFGKYTINNPETSKNAIAVGAVENVDDILDSETITNVSHYSSL